MKKALSILLVVTIFLSLGCIAEELPTVRIAVLPYTNGLPFYYMDEQGWDNECGFEIDLITFSTGGLINEALGAGLWDVASIGAAACQSLYGYDALQVFAHIDQSFGIETIVRPDSPIAQVKGYNPDYPEILGDPDTVKDATILVAIGSGDHMQASKWLSVLGLNDGDVSLVHMDTASAYQAFLSGEGDVLITTSQYTTRAHKEGWVTASSMRSLKVPYYDNIVAARDFYESENGKETLVQLLQQLLRFADLCNDDPEVYVNSMFEWYKINGTEVTIEDVRDEVLQKPFVTSAEAKGFDAGAPLKIIATFFDSIGSIDPEALEKINENIVPDILEAAIN